MMPSHTLQCFTPPRRKAWVCAVLGLGAVLSGAGCHRHVQAGGDDARSIGTADARPVFLVRALPGGRGSTRDAGGDWDDVHAAVLASSSLCELTHERVRTVNANDNMEPAGVIESITADAGHQPAPAGTERRVYDLLTSTGSTGELTLERLGPDPELLGPGAPGERIRLWATIGPLGSPGIEARLLDAIALRLEQLRGVRAAPIRWNQ